MLKTGVQKMHGRAAIRLAPRFTIYARCRCMIARCALYTVHVEPCNLHTAHLNNPQARSSGSACDALLRSSLQRGPCTLHYAHWVSPPADDSARPTWRLQQPMPRNGFLPRRICKVQRALCGSQTAHLQTATGWQGGQVKEAQHTVRGPDHDACV